MSIVGVLVGAICGGGCRQWVRGLLAAGGLVIEAGGGVVGSYTCVGE